MAGQVFQGRAPIRRRILGILRVVAFVLTGALVVVIVASAVAPSSTLELSPFVPAPVANPAASANPEASPTPTPAIVEVLNGAGTIIGAAAGAITAPFRPSATSTPVPVDTSTPIPTSAPTSAPVVPTAQPTARGGQPSTPPGQLRTPQPTPIHP